MNTFEASNGAIISLGDGELVVESPRSYDYIVSTHTQALREFFQHERDDELGRWRWPENPEYVVYLRGDGCATAVSEVSGRSWSAERGYGPTGSILSAAVVAYFDAHPERKPWEDAKPGEVWEITFSEEGGGGPDAWIVHRSMTFRNPEFVSKVPLNDPTIKTARRIYPVEVSS